MTEPAANQLIEDSVARAAKTEDRLRRVAFALVILLLLVPVWAFPYVPNVDGPAHLANATILLHYFSVPAYQKYFVLNSRPNPNLMGHLILAALMTVCSPIVAEKILVSAYVILMPIAVRYAIRALQPRAGWAVFLVFPFVYNFLFDMGFYNFSLGTIVWFFFVGYWLRRRENLGLRGTLAIAAMGLLLYTCHIFTLALAGVTVGLLGGWFTLLDVLDRRKQPRPDWRECKSGFFSRCLLTLLGLIPAVLLAMFFKLERGPLSGGKYTKFRDRVFWKALLTCQSLVSYDPIEKKISICVTILFAVIAAFVLARKFTGRQRWSRADSLIIVVAAFTFLYFFFGDLPSYYLYIPQRLRLFVFFAALLWLATQSYPRWMTRSIGLVSLALTAAFYAAHVHAYERLCPQIADFLSLSDQIPKGSTLLPLTCAACGVDENGQRVNPTYSNAYVAALMFTGGYIAADREIVDLRHYEGKVTYFPARYRDALNPFVHLAMPLVKPGPNNLDLVPPDIDIPGYEKTTDGHIDYVLLFAGNTDLPPDRAQNLATLRVQLVHDFVLVAVSPRKLTELWKHK